MIKKVKIVIETRISIRVKDLLHFNILAFKHINIIFFI